MLALTERGSGSARIDRGLSFNHGSDVCFLGREALIVIGLAIAGLLLLPSMRSWYRT
jgi:hypothetical protein